MIYSITVTNPNGDKLELELSRPEKSGFAVLSVKGLGPGKSTLNITELSNYNGGIFNSSRIAVRNIVMSLNYWFDGQKTIEELRHISYKFFPLAKQINIRVLTDTREAEIDGYVEANDPNIFSETEGADVSIVCPDPLFRSVAKENVVFSGIEPMFEFPFSNESLTEPLLVMSEIRKYKERLITYTGDATTGMVFVIHASDECGNISIYNTNTREIMKMDVSKIKELTGETMTAGDDLVINTNKGQKSLTLIRAGKTYNVLNCLEVGSDWISLIKGENVIAYSEDGTNCLQFSITYNNLYEGV